MPKQQGLYFQTTVGYTRPKAGEVNSGHQIQEEKQQTTQMIPHNALSKRPRPSFVALGCHCGGNEGPKPNLVSNPALTQFVIVMEVSQMLELYPDYSISVTLFSEVSNITELREMLIQGKLTAAFVNATMVPDVLAVLLACNKAVHLSVCGKLKTRSVYSEVVFNLSPTRDITESLKTFGLSDEYPTVLVVVINKNGTNNMANVVPLIKGQQVALTELQSIMDEHKIKKVYKIPDIELSCGSLTDAVVTRIATKDASKR